MSINTPTGWDNEKKVKIQELTGKMEDKISKNFEISQKLKDFREKWKEKIKWIDNNTKEKIINTSERFQVNENIESDWSRLIEFKLWSKLYRILDINLERYVNSNFLASSEKVEMSILDIPESGNNEKLNKYVKEKQRQWLYIPTGKNIWNLLWELGKQANLVQEEDQIAMLMYLTWMHWCYCWTHNKDYNKPILRCEYHTGIRGRSFLTHWLENYVSLCMISCE